MFLKFKSHMIFISKNFHIFSIVIFRNFLKSILSNVDYSILESAKDNIPESRNVFLKFLKNKNVKYAGFIDDDCFVDKDWLLNMIKFISKNYFSIQKIVPLSVIQS